MTKERGRINLKTWFKHNFIKRHSDNLLEKYILGNAKGYTYSKQCPVSVYTAVQLLATVNVKERKKEDEGTASKCTRAESTGEDQGENGREERERKGH